MCHWNRSNSQPNRTGRPLKPAQGLIMISAQQHCERKTEITTANLIETGSCSCSDGRAFKNKATTKSRNADLWETDEQCHTITRRGANSRIYIYTKQNNSDSISKHEASPSWAFMSRKNSVAALQLSGWGHPATRRWPWPSAGVSLHPKGQGPGRKHPPLRIGHSGLSRALSRIKPFYYRRVSRGLRA